MKHGSSGPQKRSREEPGVAPAKAETTGSEVTVTVKGMELQPAENFKGFTKCLHPLFEGFSAPTPIQSYCWPALRAGRDVIGIAETGSGKTLAFSLPMLHSIIKGDENWMTGPVRMLVMSPTRELAMQTYTVVSTAVATACIYGGQAKHEQRQQLSLKPVYVVGTPGRIIDFLNDQTLNISHVSHFVLDEADRMLSLGFEETIQEISKSLPKQRQTVMFSATWPISIQELAKTYLRSDPVHIQVGKAGATCGRVEQIVEVIEPFARDRRIIQLLEKYHYTGRNRILLFVLYKKEADRVTQMLNRNGWPAAAIHGDMAQSARTQNINAFRSGEAPLLVATDVAARGLDIPDVEYVLNYSFPLTIEDYVHRIGRTGRAGKNGVSHTFFTENDKTLAGELVATLRAAGATIPEDLTKKFSLVIRKKPHKEFGEHYKEADPNVKATKVNFEDSD